LNILDLLLDDDELGIAIRPQIIHVTDEEYDYTGVGLFVAFRCDENIARYSTDEERIILDGLPLRLLNLISEHLQRSLSKTEPSAIWRFGPLTVNTPGRN